MSDYVLREYREGDRADVISLWAEVFGDDESYISAFLELLPSLGRGAVAEKEGRVVSMAFSLDCMSFEGRRISYIYAVATYPEHRGHGLAGRLSKMAAELSDCETVSTFPAEESLYKWYSDILGLDGALHCRLEKLPARPACGTVPVTPEEYLKLREKLLSGKNHVEFTLPSAELLEKLCTTYGGGLFKLGDAVMAAYTYEGLCLIRDAVGDGLRSAAASLAFSLGCEHALLRLPSETGTPFVALKACSLPADTVWNIVFD